MTRLALLVLLAGCDPVWSLHATVRSPDGTPVTGAAMAITCPPGSSRSVSTWAELTDQHGEAELGGLGWDLPAQCTITIAKPELVTYRVTVEQVCAPHKVSDCYRVRRIEVVLEPAIAPD